MLFNSVQFAIFLPIVFILYWFVMNRNLVVQNLLLLVASYFFYACWDYRFLFLLIFSTLLDYFTGLRIHTSTSQAGRKMWLWTSIIINLGFLAAFKYYNFFATSFADALAMVGYKADFFVLNIVLPVGISFYTFHGLSYVLDIYNKRIEPTRNFVDYSVFVSFFPLLVAGPIERATHLLPQIQQPRRFNYAKAVDGLRQILWGLVKKIVIADSCANFVDMVFNDAVPHSGSTYALAALLFAFQIYCDFSGYSDIALGTARLFGIELLRNFAYPYFSRDIAEFWRRWHISLSSWFRDYLYIPLGGSRGTVLMKVRNTFIIFIVSGFWHGANWTFIIWGALNAVYFLPVLLLNRNRANLDIVAADAALPSWREFGGMLTTFALTVFAWIFFRAESVGQAFHYISNIFSRSFFQLPNPFPKIILLLTAVFLVVEWMGRRNKYAIETLGLQWPSPVRWAFYYVLVAGIIASFGAEQKFIYFQF